MFRKEDASLLKLKNYRNSVLSVVSKIFERIIQKQILENLEDCKVNKFTINKTLNKKNLINTQNWCDIK